MILKNHLPRTFVLAGAPKHGEWRSQQSLDSKSTVLFLLSQFDSAFARNCTSADDVFSVCSDIRDDILKTKKCVPTAVAREVCDFLILRASISAIGTGVASGRTGEAYDWVVQSISDRASESLNELNPTRVTRMHGLSRLIGAEVEGTLLEWYAYMFYVARVQSAFVEFCDEVLHPAHSLATATLKGSNSALAIECLINIGCWAAHFSPANAPEIAAELDSKYADRASSSKQKAMIGVALTTTLGIYTRTPVLERAVAVLHRFDSHLKEHERLQLIALKTAASCDAEQVEELICAAENHAATVRKASNSVAYQRYGAERLFELLSPCILRLIEEGATNDLTQLLCAWYGVDAPRRQGGLVVINRGKSKLHWLTESQAIEISDAIDGDEALARFTESQNAFAGTTLTVANRRGPEPKLPERQGVPAESAAPEYLNSLIALYGLDSSDISALQVSKAMALRPVPHWTSAIQPALLMTAGWTLPVSASLQQPAENRAIRRVLYWRGGTYASVFERDALQALMGRAGLAIDIVEGTQCTKEKFLQCYSSPSYDLIWITSHCEYDYFDPHKTYLTLNEEDTERAALVELSTAEVPPHGRRLLMLNVCDGATAAVLRGALGLGLANTLASSNQAVISHLWPVHQRIAPVMGALLARELIADREDYFGAYCRTIRAINQPKSDLASLIGESGGELAELKSHIDNTDLDTQNFCNWGSLVFLE